MKGVSDLVEKIVTSALLDGRMLAPRKNKSDWAFTALSALLCGAGIVLSIIAVERFFETVYRPDLAAGLTAGLVFAVSSIVMIAARKPACRASQYFGDERKSVEKNVGDFLEALQEELKEPIRDNPKTAVLLAALAGFSVSRFYH